MAGDRLSRWLRRMAVRAELFELRLFDIHFLRERTRDNNQALIRSLCDHIYLGDDTVLCRILGKYKLFVDSRDVGHSSHLMLDGYWEMWLTEAIAQHVKPGMKVADIGANLGYYTMLMADLVGAGGEVHAFEPNPPIHDRLRRSTIVNGFDGIVTIYDAPLGQEEGRLVNIAVPPAEPKNAHVVTAGEAPDAPVTAIRRLDGIEMITELDVIKIDTEGAEYDIWRGMTGLLDRTASRPLTIFLEFAKVRYLDPAAFLDELASKGFSLSVLTLADGVIPTTRQAVLDAPAAVDQMLVLAR